MRQEGLVCGKREIHLILEGMHLQLRRLTTIHLSFGRMNGKIYQAILIPHLKFSVLARQNLVLS